MSQALNFTEKLLMNYAPIDVLSTTPANWTVYEIFKAGVR